MPWADWVDGECRAVEAAGRWRRVVDLDEGLVNFASNDYLGLSRHPSVVAAAHEALDRWGAGAGAARLVAGSRPVHGDLEAAVAAWKREPAALLFPTGYAANLGVLATFGGPGRAVVVTDTVFSMDGDVAPVADLAERCAAHGALLVLDEAHAVLGPEPDLDGVDHLRVGTLSKYLGAVGGFVAGPRPFVDLLVNRARTFVFTTASSPADTAAGLAALGVLRSDEGGDLIRRLRANVDLVAPGHPSPIVPVVLGDEEAAMAASAALREQGLLVPAIRPPTVAPGSSRLRISVSATHTPAQLQRLCEALPHAP